MCLIKPSKRLAAKDAPRSQARLTTNQRQGAADGSRGRANTPNLSECVEKNGQAPCPFKGAGGRGQINLTWHKKFLSTINIDNNLRTCAYDTVRLVGPPLPASSTKHNKREPLHQHNSNKNEREPLDTNIHLKQNGRDALHQNSSKISEREPLQKITKTM